MSKRMLGLALLLTALFVGGTACAGNAKAVRKQVESSLLVKGSVIIARDGSVVSHTLDSTDALGSELTKFVDANINRWHFEPVKVDGTVVIAKVPMSLRLIAKQLDNGNIDVAIASTHFGSRADTPASENVALKGKLTPPQYPDAALRKGGKGTVYLIVQVGHDGTVTNVDAEQVNLRVVGTESEMAAMREQFTAASVRAAKRWTFTPPTTGVLANQGSWLIRIPVAFALWDERTKRNKTGQWESYVPGPRNQDMPWAQEDLMTAGKPDALGDDDIYPLKQGAKLLLAPTT